MGHLNIIITEENKNIMSNKSYGFDFDNRKKKIKNKKIK